MSKSLRNGVLILTHLGPWTKRLLVLFLFQQLEDTNYISVSMFFIYHGNVDQINLVKTMTLEILHNVVYFQVLWKNIDIPMSAFSVTQCAIKNGLYYDHHAISKLNYCHWDKL